MPNDWHISFISIYFIVVCQFLVKIETLNGPRWLRPHFNRHTRPTPLAHFDVCFSNFHFGQIQSNQPCAVSHSQKLQAHPTEDSWCTLLMATIYAYAMLYILRIGVVDAGTCFGSFVMDAYNIYSVLHIGHWVYLVCSPSHCHAWTVIVFGFLATENHYIYCPWLLLCFRFILLYVTPNGARHISTVLCWLIYSEMLRKHRI